MVAGINSRSHYTSLVLVRALVEDEGDSGAPGGGEHGVPQSPLVRAVLPEGQVTGAVRVLGGRAHLSPVDTALAAKPEEMIILIQQSSVINQ